MDLFGKTFQSLERSLDYAAIKNQTISTNIANIDTPNFKSKDIVFKNVLNDALNNSITAKRTHKKHLPFSADSHLPYKMTTRNSTSYNHNGNNVDIDKEMAELAKNQIYYQGLIDRMNGKFNSLQTVIRGGR